jgi:hypothetical protein
VLIRIEAAGICGTEPGEVRDRDGASRMAALFGSRWPAGAPASTS